MRDLTTPTVETQTVSSVKVTGFMNNREELITEIQYMTSLSDGTPHQRGSIRTDGTVEYDVLCGEIEAALAVNSDYETALSSVLYARVLAV
jgi:hypothetical protein